MPLASPLQVGSWAISVVHCVSARTKTRSKNSSSGLTRSSSPRNEADRRWDAPPARRRLERRPELLREGPGSVLWAILDTIVDSYAPVVEGLERDIEEVEETVFVGAAAPTERIYFLRREATDFHRAVHPLLS